MAQPGASANSHHARRVALWREAVRTSGLSVGLAELESACFIELSPSAAELLGTTPEGARGLCYLSVAERPREAAELFRLAKDGMLDGIRGRRSFRQANGGGVEVESSGWAIRSNCGPDLGLWVAQEVLPQSDRPAGQGEAITASLPPRRGQGGPDLVATGAVLDDYWRLARTDAGAGLLLGRRPNELRDSSIIELTHPEDRAALLFAFARSTIEPCVHVWRLRHRDGSWHTSQVTPTPLECGSEYPFAVVVAVEQGPGPLDMPSEAGKLAEHLRRMATQIEAAGMLVDTTGTIGARGMTELSRRQWEVVSRLVRESAWRPSPPRCTSARAPSETI